jgi:hypothetical protein
MEKTMSQQQRKYAMERVAEICKQKISAIEAAMPRIPEKKLNIRDAYKLILEKKVKLHSDINVLNTVDSEYFNKVFDFTEYHQRRSYDCPHYDEADFNKKCRPVLKKAQEIKDKLMLGDAQEALALLIEFEK